MLSCLNIGGPPSKPKYIFMTDSEQVPWGKGEKNPWEGSEIDPEIECLHAIEASRFKFLLWIIELNSVQWKYTKNLILHSNDVPFA